MIVMLRGLAEIRMEMSLLEMGDECHPVLVFRIFSAVADLFSLISDLRQGRGCLIDSVLTHVCTRLLFHRHVETGRSMFLLLFLLSAV